MATMTVSLFALFCLHVALMYGQHGVQLDMEIFLKTQKYMHPTGHLAYCLLVNMAHEFRNVAKNVTKWVRIVRRENYFSLLNWSTVDLFSWLAVNICPESAAIVVPFETYMDDNSFVKCLINFAHQFAFK